MKVVVDFLYLFFSQSKNIDFLSEEGISIEVDVQKKGLIGNHSLIQKGWKILKRDKKVICNGQRLFAAAFADTFTCYYTVFLLC